MQLGAEAVAHAFRFRQDLFEAGRESARDRDAFDKEARHQIGENVQLSNGATANFGYKIQRFAERV